MTTEYTYQFHTDHVPFCVGVSAIGWSFLFQGYRHILIDSDHPEWGYREDSPFGYPIVSRQDWIRAIAGHPGTLTDEYGRDHPDCLAWLTNMTPPDVTKEKLMEEEWWHMADAATVAYQIDRRQRFYWRDEEGFRFCGENMSR